MLYVNYVSINWEKYNKTLSHKSKKNRVDVVYAISVKARFILPR